MIHLSTYLHGFSGAHPTRNKTVRRHGHKLKRITLRVRPQYDGWGRNLVSRQRRVHAHLTIKAHHQTRTKNAALKVVGFKKP